ncbi:hypothetical protein [Flavobacterium sp.]|uniref:hypothetical protein n=1 Tax=Flavobacterium sp. TaxID=239 RepID=UPI0035281DCB
MIEQITELVKQFGGDAIVNNPSVPNEKNDAVAKETGESLISSLQSMVAEGKLGDLAGLLGGKSEISMDNPTVKELTNKVTNSLSQKTGISNEAAQGISADMIPNILGGLLGKANDKSDSSFNIQDIIKSITGGDANASGGLMDMVTKYGGQFGLDQNGDGKVDMNDAIAAVSGGGKKGGLGGLLGNLFGKK